MCTILGRWRMRSSVCTRARARCFCLCVCVWKTQSELRSSCDRIYERSCFPLHGRVRVGVHNFLAAVLAHTHTRAPHTPNSVSLFASRAASRRCPVNAVDLFDVGCAWAPRRTQAGRSAGGRQGRQGRRWWHDAGCGAWCMRKRQRRRGVRISTLAS